MGDGAAWRPRRVEIETAAGEVEERRDGARGRRML